MKSGFLIHGGAGSWDEREEEAKQAIERIADRVVEESDNLSALDMVEFAVRLLEEDKEFNSGRGAKFQSDGEIRLDASIMRSDLEAGAVIGLEGDFLHPVSIAKKVMEDTHHVALKGLQAKDFADKFSFEKADLEVDHRKSDFEEMSGELEDLEFEEKIARLEERHQTGTVGAVAVDSEGRMAAATSTGGVEGQLAGRIGDTPMPGCGTYCNETAAVSATGIGEAIIKTTLTRRCCRHIEEGKNPEEAVEKSLEFLREKTGREAGLITVDKEGRMAAGFNSDKMVWTEREL